MEWWRPDFFYPVLGAVIAGAAVGFEREYRSRAAGFRTHILVCMTSAILMLAAKHQVEWAGPEASVEILRIDPVRMAHGILTGIGFLCGGVIFKEGLNIHGLTTAASLWITSALGMLFGVGFYGLGIGATLSTIVVLGLLRALDNHMPGQTVLDLNLRFKASEAPREARIRELIARKGVHVGRISQCLQDRGEILQYTAGVEARGGLTIEEIIERVREEPSLMEYTAYHRSG